MSPRSARLRTGILVLCLFALALGLRTFRAHQLPVIMPDTIRHIEQAQRLPEDLVAALREEVYHPLHAAAIFLVHHHVLPRAEMTVAGERLSWAMAAQVVGVFCGALMAPLLFFLARRLGARPWAALAAAFLWCLQKRTSSYGADGMSDMLALCLFTGSILLALRGTAIRDRHFTARHGTFILCAGLLAGLGYLARPEVLAAPLILSISLLVTWALSLLRKSKPSKPRAAEWKFLPRRSLPLKSILIMLTIVWAATAIPAAPYAAVIGNVTHKKQINPPPEVVEAVPPGPVKALSWAWTETAKTFGYGPMAVLLAALAMHTRWWCRPRFRVLIVAWVGLWVPVMLWLLLNYGYLAGRHTLILQVLLFAMLALTLQQFETRIFPAIARPLGLYRVPKQIRRTPVVPLAITGILAVIAIPTWLRPAWPEMIAQAKAAAWIRTHLAEDIIVADRQLVVGYYAMRPYQRWWGNPNDEIDRMKTTTAKPIILGKYFERPEDITLTLGKYQAIAIFNDSPSSLPAPQESSPPKGRLHGIIYVLYAAPGDPVAPGGSQPTFIDLSLQR